MRGEPLADRHSRSTAAARITGPLASASSTTVAGAAGSAASIGAATARSTQRSTGVPSAGRVAGHPGRERVRGGDRVSRPGQPAHQRIDDLRPAPASVRESADGPVPDATTSHAATRPRAERRDEHGSGSAASRPGAVRTTIAAPSGIDRPIASVNGPAASAAAIVSRIDDGAAVDAAEQQHLPGRAPELVERQRPVRADETGRRAEQRRDRRVVGQAARGRCRSPPCRDRRASSRAVAARASARRRGRASQAGPPRPAARGGRRGRGVRRRSRATSAVAAAAVEQGTVVGAPSPSAAEAAPDRAACRSARRRPRGPRRRRPSLRPWLQRLGDRLLDQVDALVGERAVRQEPVGQRRRARRARRRRPGSPRSFARLSRTADEHGADRGRVHRLDRRSIGEPSGERRLAAREFAWYSSGSSRRCTRSRRGRAAGFSASARSWTAGEREQVDLVEEDDDGRVAASTSRSLERRAGSLATAGEREERDVEDADVARAARAPRPTRSGWPAPRRSPSCPSRPGPSSSGLRFVRRSRTSTIASSSRSRPTIGPSLPSRARPTRSRPNRSSVGVDDARVGPGRRSSRRRRPDRPSSGPRRSRAAIACSRRSIALSGKRRLAIDRVGEVEQDVERRRR